jgi:AcrR family transcriptional regulator
VAKATPPPSATAGRRSVGRPRQFDVEVERALIIKSAFDVLQRIGSDVTIADILAEAGISTRSFYRHFESKDALLLAMYRRDSEYAAQRLTQRVESEDSPVRAVTAWIDEIFSFRRSASKSARMATLGTVHTTSLANAFGEGEAARQRFTKSLAMSIDEGISDGIFSNSNSTYAAEMIYSVVMHAIGVTGGSTTPRIDQETVTEFCLRALGVQR